MRVTSGKVRYSGRMRRWGRDVTAGFRLTANEASLVRYLAAEKRRGGLHDRQEGRREGDGSGEAPPSPAECGRVRGAIAPRREKRFDDLWRVAAFGLVEPSRGAPDPGERVLRETPLVGWNTEDRQACEAVVEREDEGGVG
jgi:hypothetical protein